MGPSRVEKKQTVQAKPKWEKFLTFEVETKLKEMGRLLGEARKRRRMSTLDLASRSGIDRRTLAQLEKGSPKVSLGIFLQVLSMLNLLRGIDEVVQPYNDIEGLASAVQKARRRQKVSKKIADEKVNF
jgi:transcriptional regulator with XRE-family HTH domain